MKSLYELAGINQTTTTPYHPMGNGLSERFNETLLSMIGTLTNEKKKAWPKYLADLVLAKTHLLMSQQDIHHTSCCLAGNLDSQ